MVEQKIALLSEFCDMLLIMEDGGVRFQGSPDEVLEHSEELLAMGVNCPRSTTLVNRLRARNLYRGKAVRSVPQAVLACKEAVQ